MAISNETIINKMIQELQEAKKAAHQQEIVNQHIANVRLLSELFTGTGGGSDLKSSRQTMIEDTEESFSDAEIKAMFGKLHQSNVVVPEQNKLEDDDANGDSIFDF